MSDERKKPIWPWIIGGLLLLNFLVGVAMFCAVLWIGKTFRNSPDQSSFRDSKAPQQTSESQ